MGQRAVGLGIVTAMLAIGSLFACRQAIGIDQYFNAPADAGSTACGLPYGTTKCASCVNTSCCTESSACSSSPACAPYETCVARCTGDPECRSQCTVDNPIGIGSSREISTLSACVAAKCDTVCGLSCGGVAEYLSPPASAAQCEGCVKANACDTTTACGASADCDAYVRCILSCATLDCAEACATRYPVGIGLLGGPLGGFGPSATGTFSGVYVGGCAAPCAVGGNWACVPRRAWPTPESTTTTITFEGVHVGPTGVPVDGADVSICVPADTACASPLNEGRTDPSGRISLTVPTAQGNSPVPMGLIFYAKVMNTTAAGYATTYYYPGGPLSAATLSFPPARSPPLIPSGDLAKVGDPTLGYIGAYALDCTGSLAAGVEVSADNADAGVPFHWSGATGQNGGASFYNVPEGPLVLTATPASLGKVSSRVSVYVRAGASTQVVLLPTP